MGSVKQRGTVLLLSMVLLVLLGLLGVLAMQASTQQTRMASNLLASMQALEAAESLLRTAEARLAAAGAGATSAWQQAGAGRYLIQRLGESDRALGMPEDLPVILYRITAIAEERHARVVLESVVAWPRSPDQGPARRILWRQISRES